MIRAACLALAFVASLGWHWGRSREQSPFDDGRGEAWHSAYFFARTFGPAIAALATLGAIVASWTDLP